MGSERRVGRTQRHIKVRIEVRKPQILPPRQRLRKPQKRTKSTAEPIYERNEQIKTNIQHFGISLPFVTEKLSNQSINAETNVSNVAPCVKHLHIHFIDKNKKRTRE